MCVCACVRVCASFHAHIINCVHPSCQWVESMRIKKKTLTCWSTKCLTKNSWSTNKHSQFESYWKTRHGLTEFCLLSERMSVNEQNSLAAALASLSFARVSAFQRARHVQLTKGTWLNAMHVEFGNVRSVVDVRHKFVRNDALSTMVREETRKSHQCQQTLSANHMPGSTALVQRKQPLWCSTQ